ncbi:hypothetical protein AcW1_008019 [Taiwanofungus camphoratus]|nr:hypothetical protein AcW1_008019 [Antrodia cinnamomea]KAI0955728.1 hypothetical protein AcV7_006311 [Antrodia cinnamomea]
MQKSANNVAANKRRNTFQDVRWSLSERPTDPTSPPSSTSSSAPSDVISMARNAERNNEKLFPIFRKNLSDGALGAYAMTAGKLTLWLSRDKAYYPRARPIIVELLETAHAAVCRASGYPDQPFHISRCPEGLKPWADPFMTMIRTVSSFVSLFTEPQLQVRLRTLVQTIEPHEDPPGVQPQSSVGIASIPTAPLRVNTQIPSSVSAHSVQGRQDTRSPAGRLSGHASPSIERHSPAVSSASGWPPQPMRNGARPAQQGGIPVYAHVDPEVKTELVESFAASVPSISNVQPKLEKLSMSSPSTASTGSTSMSSVSAPIPLPRLNSRTSPTSSTSHVIPEVTTTDSKAPMESPASSIQSRSFTIPRVKSKAKRKFTFEDDFIQADLAWFKDAAKQPSKEEAPANETSAVSGCRNSTEKTKAELVTAEEEPWSNVEISSSCGVANEDVAEVRTEVLHQCDVSEAENLDAVTPEKAKTDTDKSGQPTSPPKRSFRMGKRPRMGPRGGHESPEPPTGSPKPICERGHDEVGRADSSFVIRSLGPTLTAVSDGTPASAFAMQRPDAGIHVHADRDLQNAESLPHQTTSKHLFVADEAGNLQVSDNLVDGSVRVAQTEHHVGGQSVTKSQEMEVNVTPEGHFSPSRKSPEGIAGGEKPDHSMGDTMISDFVVLVCARGSSDPTLDLEFEIDSNRSAALCEWVSRYNSREDVSSSRCLTLASYSFLDCLQKARSDPRPSLEKIAADTPTTWPQDGRLWAELSNGKGQKKFMLSPPFIVCLNRILCRYS